MALKRTRRSNRASGRARRSIVGTKKPKFSPGESFHTKLRQRVAQYFQSTGRRPRDCPQMYVKTAAIFAWLLGSYLLLLFGPPWWLAVPLAASLGLAIAAVGFNVQHDGGHQAYSDRPWVNRLMALTLDLLGGSSYVWASKHNTIHHTYTNVTGHDDDINLGALGRLSPHQPRWPFHRLQHLYLWALYGFLPAKWVLFDDFYNLVTGRIGQHRFVRPKGWDLAILLGFKALFYVLAFGIPLLFHPVWVVLLIYALASFVQGVALATVFQLAHCVELAAFPLPREDTGRLPTAWAEHQVETTVDFARGNRLLSWFVGGLNFQIEHHLFPRICHIHYPALSRLVEETCREFGLQYRSHQTFWAAVASHFRWLRRMGMGSRAEESGRYATT